LAAEGSVDMENLVTRMKTQSKYDYCLTNLKNLEDIKGGVEYARKACELSQVRARLFTKHSFLKELSFDEYKYLLFSDTQISINPNDLIIKQKQNNEK